MALDHKAHRELKEGIMDMLFGSRTPTGYHSPEEVARRASNATKVADTTIDNQSIDARLPMDHLLPTHIDYNHPHVQTAISLLRDKRKGYDSNGNREGIKVNGEVIQRKHLAFALLRDANILPHAANAHTYPHTLHGIDVTDGGNLVGLYHNGGRWNDPARYGSETDHPSSSFRHQFLPKE